MSFFDSPGKDWTLDPECEVTGRTQEMVGRRTLDMSFYMDKIQVFYPGTIG